MLPKNTPSDAYFKSSLQQVEVARDLFRAHLPKALLEKLDLQKLELRSESFIDDDLKKHIVDVLYQTKFKDESAYIYVLAEHQSQAQKILPIRLLKYLLLVMDYHLKRYKTDKPPLVVPLVIYNGKTKYPYSMNWLALFEEQESLARELYTKPFQLVDLSQLEDETLQAHATAGLMEWCLKHTQHQHIMQYMETLLALLDSTDIFKNQSYLLQSIRYMMYNMSSENTDKFISTIKTHLPPPVAEHMMTIAESLRQQGIQQGVQQGIQQGVQQGIQQGVQQGILEGEKQMLLELMSAKFDNIPHNYRVRIAQGNSQSFRIWIRNILKAQTLDDVFKEPI